MNYINEVTVEYSPIFKKQTAYGSAIAQGSLTQAMRADIKRMTPEFASKFFTDCTTQYLQTKRTLARWVSFEIEFETTPHIAAGWWAFACGQDSSSGTNPLTHQMNLISGRSLPVTTLRMGFDDGVDVGWLIKDVAVNSIRISATSGFDSTVKVALGLIGSGNFTAATGTTWAACYSTAPATLFDAGGVFTVNAVGYLTSLHSVSVEYSNNINPEAMFVAGDDDVSRVIRSRVRTYNFQFQLEGADTSADALATLARANTGAGTIVTSTLWTFGTSNNLFTFNIPSGYLSYQGTPQGFLGDNQGEVAVLNLQVQARKITSGATEPCNVTAVLDTTQQSVAFLTT